MRALMLWVCMSASVLASDRSPDTSPTYELTPGDYILSGRTRPHIDEETELSYEACRVVRAGNRWWLTLTDQGVIFSGPQGLRRLRVTSTNLADEMIIFGTHTGPDEVTGRIACERELIATFVLSRRVQEPRELTESEMVLYILNLPGRKP